MSAFGVPAQAVDATQALNRSRSDRAAPAAIPREISSRSANVSASRERRRRLGKMPPCGAT